jgi:hypothetical protein
VRSHPGPRGPPTGAPSVGRLRRTRAA